MLEQRQLQNKSKKARCREKANRPGLEVEYGVLHPFLVVFAHVLVHVWVVGADVFFCTPIGHCAKLQRWILLLGMLKLAEQREAREAGGGTEGA